MSTPLATLDAKRQALGPPGWTPEETANWHKTWKHHFGHALHAIEEAARDRAAVAVTQDGAQEQPAVAGSAVLPPPPPLAVARGVLAIGTTDADDDDDFLSSKARFFVVAGISSIILKNY